MSESRICPVCEIEIPEDARFLCPHCHFDLKWLDDEKAVEIARQNLKGVLNKVDESLVEDGKQSNNESDNKLSLALIGFIGGLLGFILSAIGGQVARNIFPQLLFTLILSTLIGYIWKITFKNGRGCLFAIAVIIGILAPVLLIFILFPGGY